MLVVVALWLLDYVEHVLPKVRYRTVTIRRKWQVGLISQTIERFEAANLKVVDASFERTKDLVSVDVSLDIAFTDRTQYYNLERQLEHDSDYILLAARER